MTCRFLAQTSFLLSVVCAFSTLHGQTAATPDIKVDWKKPVIVSKTTPTLQVVVNPMILRGSKMHDGTFRALHNLGADYVRYVPWLPYPKQAVAELDEPKDGKTSWNFDNIDPAMEDFMQATQPHSVCINFSTIPAWMYKTTKPVEYPADPNQVFWKYTQGNEMRDPTYKEAADYFARLLSWYEKGGFTDEFGKRHESGHHYKIAYWEVLNEIDFEHHWKPQDYTRFYDTVTEAMRKVDPDIKFMGISLASPSTQPEMFEYFLNPAHHRPGAPLDFISYHFYAGGSPRETLDDWQYTFFTQAQGFVTNVRYVEAIRKRLSPNTRTDLNELGVILHADSQQQRPDYVFQEFPPEYWNLAGAMYAHLFIEFSRMGIDVLGESQLVGYPSQYPSVSMMDYNNAPGSLSKPNARYWVLKLLHDHFAVGDTLYATSGTGDDVSAQGYDTKGGKKLLLVNRRRFETDITIPVAFAGGSISLVAPSTGDNPPATMAITGRTVHLASFETAVLSAKK